MTLRSHPALVVVDVQNGFCHAEGFMAQIGLDPSASAAVVPAIGRLVEAARRAGIPIAYTRYALNEDYSDAGLLLDTYPAIAGTGGLVRGSWDADLMDELSPEPGELVLDKTRQSAFHGTELAEWLAERDVDQIVVCGVTTNMCVESTVRDGYARDLFTTVVADATAAPMPELHEAALTSFRYGFGPDPVATTAEVESELAARVA